MATRSSDSISILEGKALLYRRENTPHYQVRFRIHGRYFRHSTKTDDIDKAKAFATEIVMNAWYREKNELPPLTKKFKAVAKLALDRMKELQSVGKGKASFKTYTQALERYFVPYLGNHNIDRIDNAVMNKFSAWRIQEMGKVPTGSTVNNHNSALNRVFDEAVLRGYMTRIQVPMLVNEGIKSGRRPDFTLDEYTTLYRSMRRWINSGRKGNETLMRLILREYVLVLANTGIRAGTEAMNLMWNQVRFIRMNGNAYLTLNVDGKTGAREVICRHCVARYLDRLRKLTTAHKTGSFEDFLKKQLEQPVFQMGQKDMTTSLGKVFQRLLIATELLVDPRTKTPRTLYSLRHTYATLALTHNRVSIYNLAQHMGTSVAMIEQYYGHVQLRNLAHEIAGDKEFDGWETTNQNTPTKKQGRRQKIF